MDDPDRVVGRIVGAPDVRAIPADDGEQLIAQRGYARVAGTLLEVAAARKLPRVTVTIGLGGFVVRLAGSEQGRREAFAAWTELLGVEGGVVSTAGGLLARGFWMDAPVALVGSEVTDGATP